ncbi:MAG: hypothetical protein N3A69_00625 [Leptospiraceae bacterium]|nr:hypothetical protein [Leptospiraceae bacterium]
MPKEKNKENKKKKIAKMSITEIEQALKKSRDNNNIDTSKYVIHLKNQLEFLRSKKG